MAVRVDQLVPYGYTDTAISTFHAFGDGLIREYALELGLPTDLRVLSRPEVVIFLREHLFEFDLDAYRPLGDPTRFLAALATLFSRCKDEDISPADYLAHADRVAAEAAFLGRGGGRRRGRPARDRRGRRPRRGGPPPGRARPRLRDLPGPAGGQRLHRLRRPGRARPPARPDLAGGPRRAIAGRFRYILVDEFQDTNRAQAELVAALAEGHRNVTVVGDDDQAIYAFRGAAIDNILDFQDRYLGARTVVLRRNYRSLAPILDAAYRLIRFNDPDRLEVRTGIVKRLRAAADRRRRRRRSGSRSSPRARRRRTGSPPRSAGGSRPAPRRATTPSSSAPTATPTRSCGPSTWPAIPWRFSGTSGPVRPAGGPAAARVPAGRRRPRVERRPVRRSRRRRSTGSAART